MNRYDMAHVTVKLSYEEAVALFEAIDAMIANEKKHITTAGNNQERLMHFQKEEALVNARSKIAKGTVVMKY